MRTGDHIIVETVAAEGFARATTSSSKQSLLKVVPGDHIIVETIAAEGCARLQKLASTRLAVIVLPLADVFVFAFPNSLVIAPGPLAVRVAVGIEFWVKSRRRHDDGEYDGDIFHD